MDLPSLTELLANARAYLLAQRGAHGHWEGRLSSSALSTAITVCALRAYAAANPGAADIEPAALRALCRRGLDWLVEHQNEDGGWGDTTLSRSNISTTSLGWAAFAGHEAEHEAGSEAGHSLAVERCERWLTRHVVGDRATPFTPAELAEAVKRRYGDDHTFSVPILTALALTGRLGPADEAWRLVPQLPFELASLPRSWYSALGLPVVSYALPALIAIGQVRHHHAPTWLWPHRWLRDLSISTTLDVLQEIQPESGGFLEASPLTSFVTLSLVGAGRADHPVARRGVRFLVDSMRDDGSWPIDTNLATWVTTLSINALAAVGDDAEPRLDAAERETLLAWLLEQQYRETHPYTLAAPGAWAWTDLSGGVPDADDTPGALLALRALGDGREGLAAAAAAGVVWLLDLQNSDGGLPTFCRGCGHLPFDRSSADLTAHAIRAWLAWRSELPAAVQDRVAQGLRRALDYLISTQRADGAWTPLWFGNQFAPDDENPVYGTSRVVLALAAVAASAPEALPREASARGVNWLLAAQHAEGGWGGAAGTPVSIEETSLAIEALAAAASSLQLLSPPEGKLAEQMIAALERGLVALSVLTNGGKRFPPSPIGFYFAKLWYYEDLYPASFATAALGRALQELQRQQAAEALHGAVR